MRGADILITVSTDSTYCIINPNRLIAKIGRAKNVLRRLETLQTDSADQLYLAEVIGPLPGINVEHSLHKALEPWRVHGEWFDGPIALSVFQQVKAQLTHPTVAATIRRHNAWILAAVIIAALAAALSAFVGDYLHTAWLTLGAIVVAVLAFGPRDKVLAIAPTSAPSPIMPPVPSVIRDEVEEARERRSS